MSETLGADFSSVGEVNPGARVQLRGLSEMLSPAVCSLCGNGTHHLPYVDPAIYIDWYGQVYFCQNCMREMANTIGMLDPDQTKFLLTLNQELAEENKRLKDDLDGLANIRNVLRVALAPDASGNPSVPSEEAAEATGQDAGDSTESLNDGTVKSPEPVESGKVNGPDAPTRTPSRHAGLLT